MHILFTSKTLVTSNTTLAELLIIILIHSSKSAGDRSELSVSRNILPFSRSFIANHFYFTNISFFHGRKAPKRVIHDDT